jgi:hypothetical protein
VFHCRSLTRSLLPVERFTKPDAFDGVFGRIGLQLALTYSSPVDQLFGTTPMSGTAWRAILTFDILLHQIVEIEKKLVGQVVQGGSYRKRFRNEFSLSVHIAERTPAFRPFQQAFTSNSRRKKPIGRRFRLGTDGIAADTPNSHDHSACQTKISPLPGTAASPAKRR